MSIRKPIPIAAPPEEAIRRTRGRPRKPNAHVDSEGLSREAIILKAAQLAQGESLEEISMVRLGRELGVVPGLIHYYVGSRDDLLSGVLNHYFQARVAQMTAPTGDWKEDIRQVAHASLRSMMLYPGIAGYIATHNRFRLFQKVGPDEIDYGLEFFNRVGDVLRRGGLSPKAAALGYHLLMQFIVVSAANEIGGQTPGRHKKFIRARLAGLDPQRYAGAHYIAEDFAQLDFAETFESGLQMLLLGIQNLP